MNISTVILCYKFPDFFLTRNVNIINDHLFDAAVKFGNGLMNNSVHQAFIKQFRVAIVRVKSDGVWLKAQKDERMLLITKRVYGIRLEQLIMEKELQTLGKDQRMSNWILKASNDWLTPVFEAMHTELQNRGFFTRMKPRFRFCTNPENRHRARAIYGCTEPVGMPLIRLYCTNTSRTGKRTTPFHF